MRGQTYEGRLCNTCGSTLRRVSNDNCVPCSRRYAKAVYDSQAGDRADRKAENGGRMIRPVNKVASALGKARINRRSTGTI